MSKMTPQQESQFWADKLMDLANLSGAVLIFGQLASDVIYWQGVILGIVIYAVIMFVARNLLRR